MTIRLQTWPGVLLGALLVAALMMLAVACGTETADDVPADAPTADSSTDTDPEVGDRVGNLAPDFSVTTTDGVTRSLTDFKQANQPVVVYFFASW